MSVHAVIEGSALLAEVAGVAVILGGALLGVFFALRRVPSGGTSDAYHRYRRFLGRSILLGLELLVAADIIRTISTVPTLENATVLALIVAIRTFLSTALVVELEGRWPWQRPQLGRRRDAEAEAGETS